MIIDVIHVVGFRPFEPKDQSPVARHVDGRITAPLAPECVQVRPRKVYILGLARSVQAGEKHTQPLDMVGDYPGFAARLVELFEALVPEALNHAVTSWVTV